MKGEKTTCAFLLAMLIMFILSMATVSVGPSQPKIFVDPPTYMATLLGEVFTVNIKITNVQDLKCFDFKLGYNTTLLDVLDAVVGPFPPRPLKSSLIEIHEPEGYVWISVASRGAANGNGTLATITFNATYAESASCTLDLYETYLYDSYATPIIHDVGDGNYMFRILGLTVATNKTTYQPGENVEIRGNLTLDGSPWQGLVAIEVDDPTGFYKKVVRTMQIGAAPPPGNITLVDVVPCDSIGNPVGSFWIGDKPYFKATVRNDGSESKTATTTINAYDGNMVPLPGVPTISQRIDPGINVIIAGTHNIPDWAYIGTAKVYANLFTDLPRNDGVPYSPEKSATFQITGGGGGRGGGAGLGNSSTAGNYTLTFKLPPDAVTGAYRVYASSLYRHALATDSTVFGINTICVPTHYPTIQRAIDAATPTNKTILVFPKTYNERVTINNKSLTLIGIDPSNTIINGSRTGTVVTVTAGKVEISGFTIKNSGGSLSDSAITLNNSSDCTISGNTILNNHNGIYLTSSSRENIIRGNTITSNNGYGINIHSSDNNDILDNMLSNNNYGICLNYSTGTTLRENDMICNKYNFGIFGSSLSDFTHNIDTSNTVDGKPIIYWINQQNKPVPSNAGYVAIVNSTRIVVKELNLTKNGQGVLFAFTNNSLIGRVNIYYNEYGIYLVHSHSNTIVGSTVSSNAVGIYQNYCNENTICHNNFVSNTDQAELYQSSNTWDDNAGKGNYWSDYTGEDNGSGGRPAGDGVGDTLLPHQGVDWYPLMNPVILVHDVAITNVKACDALYGLTEAYPGWDVNVTVTVKNTGDFTDTFSITAYYDGKSIGTKTCTVTPQTQTAITFTWDTRGITPCKNYTIKANATIIGFIGITDEKVDGQVHFRITGDVRPDGRVSTADMVWVDIALGSKPGDPNWYPYADVNGDGRISIADMVQISIHLGESCQ